MRPSVHMLSTVKDNKCRECGLSVISVLPPCAAWHSNTLEAIREPGSKNQHRSDRIDGDSQSDSHTSCFQLWVDRSHSANSSIQISVFPGFVRRTDLHSRCLTPRVVRLRLRLPPCSTGFRASPFLSCEELVGPERFPKASQIDHTTTGSGSKSWTPKSNLLHVHNACVIRFYENPRHRTDPRIFTHSFGFGSVDTVLRTPEEHWHHTDHPTETTHFWKGWSRCDSNQICERSAMTECFSWARLRDTWALGHWDMKKEVENSMVETNKQQPMLIVHIKATNHINNSQMSSARSMLNHPATLQSSTIWSKQYHVLACLLETSTMWQMSPKTTIEFLWS